MSELLHYLSPQPASTPVYTKGNFFYRDGERFFIKGISYIPPPVNAEQRPPPAEPLNIDPLADDQLGELKKDIPLLRDLGLNTISVGNLSPSNSHTAALQLLEQNGIYVLVNIFSSIRPPPDPIVHGRVQFDATSDPKPYYTLTSVLETFPLLDELAEHPNVLGFAVDAEVIVSPGLTPLATVFRACIRDSKDFLARRGKRAVPVGVATSQNQALQRQIVQYFSAGGSGSSSEAPSTPGRADFVAYDNWAWAGKSDFQMSGWKNEVEMYGRLTRLPMLLNAYGTNVSQPRVWEEVLCLYSPDMTGVFSGGFAYTFFEYGKRKYGLVEIDADGRRKPRQEFNSFRNKFRRVNVRFEDELAVAERKDHEGWVGEFPELEQGRNGWRAETDLPEFPGSWEDVMQVVRGQRSD
ncbi:hypothetical protein KC343_g6593 [Hortaea werneckii]|uniref:1,3-beta-glucanosyltransferase n=1 Tax=Hortaea werneckii TaxID=91943 RepID=A0A3M7DCR0_HORWE|nr:hypothetical protein KC317_g4760 [Hortaea werneckii]KAI7617509.1 hypothetical protein KC346_g5434 [Hortaea werneckii]KAI7625616.1 hypothetical protein KC343_g6593 [Hortaea werneckii]KAI7651558.1 hypothetical protein KC319_g10846 [Hortaea werneckii]KAI7687331.1 hypothetical protein KC322_g12506 [Hortaea werneckii]